LMPKLGVRLLEAAPLRAEISTAKASDFSDAGSDVSTCLRRSVAWSDITDEAELESPAQRPAAVTHSLPDGILRQMLPQQDELEVEPSNGRTTVMIRNLPEGFSRTRLEQLLDGEGFGTCYRFIYLPTDIAMETSFFYAFVDLATPEDATRVQQHFSGFTRWPYPSSKVAAVDWSEALQGIDQLVERYRNSPLMHARVPDGLRPAMYHNGRRLIFPVPTVRVKAPRVRRSSSRRAQRLNGLRPPAYTQ